MNDAQTHVAEALEGFELAHRDLVALNREPAYVTRRNLSATPKVGSWPEPPGSSARACSTRRSPG